MFSASSPTLPLASTLVNNTLLIQIPARLSVIEAPSFRTHFQELLQREAALTKVILDFSQTTLIDSSGIGSFLTSLKIAQQRNIKVVVWSLNSQVQFAFSLAGLEQLFELEPNTDPTPTTPNHQIAQRPLLTHRSVKSPIKRAIDIVGSLVGLGITAILFVPIAIAIKLDSPGPIFFRQVRCGLMGRRFRIWKFRSMVTNAEALKHQVTNQVEGAFFKNDHDPRITRVGRFLRKTSLDELPQFWNVLKGDMSLIGTRPPTLEELSQYEILNWQRLDVRPGLSGEWQVNGRSKVRKFEDVIRLDLHYQENWSLMYDLKLMLKTVIILFTKDSGAV
jgi:anti-anti-sigma factor